MASLVFVQIPQWKDAMFGTIIYKFLLLSFNHAKLMVHLRTKEEFHSLHCQMDHF